MSERSPEALHAALAIMSQPQLLQRARRSSLPRGMTLLLQVAAGDPDAIREAQAATGRSEDHLTKAAGFYTEQVLLHRDSDSYRVLGASSSASAAELRRHLALILRWLHPDLVPSNADGLHFDKSALANLVTRAWETIKTGERRAAYDAKPRIEPNAKAKSAPRTSVRSAGKSSMVARPSNHGSRRLALYKLEGDPFWIRVLRYLGREN